MEGGGEDFGHQRKGSWAEESGMVERAINRMWKVGK